MNENYLKLSPRSRVAHLPQGMLVRWHKPAVKMDTVVAVNILDLVTSRPFGSASMPSIDIRIM